ncbi:MAG: PD40 domain-containing protein [Proteobacteria bacterium]|nr:PD40 domain-containing protein [Pseudomonadota bacterium]
MIGLAFWLTLSASTTLATPTEFLPEVPSGSAVATSPSFFPGGRMVIFTHAEKNSTPANSQGYELRLSTQSHGKWTASRTAPFSGSWRDLEPAVAPNGRVIIFASSRPASGHGDPLDGHWGGKDYPSSGGALWKVERKGSGWGAPVRLPDIVNDGTSVFAPAIAADGTLYFMKPDPVTGKFHLFRASLVGGTYAQVAPMPFTDEKVTDVDSAVAPDQSYLVFCSSRETPGRLNLFVAFRRGGGWSKPMRLPDAVNGASSNTEARLSADQRTLYFSHDGKIWQTPFQPVLAWAKTVSSDAG